MLRFGLCVVCLVMANAVFAAPTDRVVHVSAEWSMSLDANGTITALEAKPGRVKDALRRVLETAIRSWKFEPGSINGMPAATDTNLDVSFSVWLTPGDESYSVRVDDVQTGGSIEKIGKRVLPRFCGHFH